MSARRDSMTVDGGRVETAWWGKRPEEAPTILLLHEGLGSVDLWRGFPAALAEATGCGVLAYSRLGYGRSDPVPLPRPLTYMHDEARDILPRVIEAAGLKRVLLLGHSDGATIAAIHAGSLQDFAVRGLVLMAPHFCVEDSGLEAIRTARARYESELRARLARWHDHVDIAFRGWNEAWLDPGFPAVLDLQPELAHIRVPLLIVQGEADPYGTLEQLRMAERETYCPVEALILPGIGHAPHLEAPEPVLAAVRDFATRLFKVHEAEMQYNALAPTR